MLETPTYEKTCSDCHKVYSANSPTAVYCPECRVKRYRLKNPQHDVECQYRKCRAIFKSSYARSKFCCDSHRVLEFNAVLEDQKRAELAEQAKLEAEAHKMLANMIGGISCPTNP